MASTSGSTAYTLDNVVFRMFLTYGTLLLFKMLSLAFVTVRNRVKYAVFASPEDRPKYYQTEKAEEKHRDGSEQLDRVKRCHLNDLENIPAFLLIGLMYVAIEPSTFAAAMHFRVFTIARYIHSFVYLFAVPQPARGLCFLVGLFTTISMGVQILMAESQF